MSAGTNQFSGSSDLDFDREINPARIRLNKIGHLDKKSQKR
jgi:hypothetical protein